MSTDRRKDPHRYDDIIDLPRPVSGKHRPMSREDRAAQFAPFAALTGHGEAIAATARRVEAEVEEENRNDPFDGGGLF